MISKQYGFDFDADRCVQCHACELACKGLHGVELGLRWRRVIHMWSGQFPDIKMKSFSISCMHCGAPACEASCPTGAIKKRHEDGIVVVDQDKCIGCRSCFLACPFGVPQYGANGKMQKCDLCADRLKGGYEPACVATCPADALHFGTMSELSIKKTERASQKILTMLLVAPQKTSPRKWEI